MNQKEFSEIVKDYIFRNYPEFLENITYHNDNSFDCELRSETNLFSIWIATYNSEITIGLKDPSNKTDIHTHITLYEYENEDFKEAFDLLNKYISEIKNEKTILIMSENGIYNWIDNSEFIESTSIKISWLKHNVT